MPTNASYIHSLGEKPLVFETLGNLLDYTASKHPDVTAVSSMQQNKQLTYKQLLDEADKFATGLQKIGMQKGERLGLWAPNSIEWIVINLACCRLGLIMVALNPANKTTEMKFCINKVEVKAIVCPVEGKYHNYFDVLGEIIPEIKTNKSGKLQSNNFPSLEHVILISDRKLSNDRGVYTYEKIISLATEDAIQQLRSHQTFIQPDDACSIQFSSGTTGLPKAAVATHFHVVNSARETGRRLGLDNKHHTMCIQVPFFHVFALTCGLTAAVNFGATVVIPSFYYSSKANLRAIKEKNCTMIYGTPTMYIDLITLQKQQKLDISPEFAITAGANCPPELFEEITNVLHVQNIKSIYGQTENGGAISQSLLTTETEYHTKHTVGKIVDHIQVKVIDTNGRVVPMGQPGELCIRGYSTMLKYWNDEKRTNEVFDTDRWLKTGDQVILREDGYLSVVGRIKEMINRGGENVFPKEIEDYISTHSDVAEVYVIGVPHERLGEDVCAFIKLRNGGALRQEDLVNFLREKIAHFKIPSCVRIVEDFPKTASGKIQKYKLKELFMESV